MGIAMGIAMVLLWYCCGYCYECCRVAAAAENPEWRRRWRPNSHCLHQQGTPNDPVDPFPVIAPACGATGFFVSVCGASRLRKESCHTVGHRTAPLPIKGNQSGLSQLRQRKADSAKLAMERLLSNLESLLWNLMKQEATTGWLSSE